MFGFRKQWAQGLQVPVGLCYLHPDPCFPLCRLCSQIGIFYMMGPIVFRIKSSKMHALKKKKINKDFLYPSYPNKRLINLSHSPDLVGILMNQYDQEAEIWIIYPLQHLGLRINSTQIPQILSGGQEALWDAFTRGSKWGWTETNNKCPPQMILLTLF